MVRYNITISGCRQPLPEGPYPPAGIAGRRMAHGHSRPKGWFKFQLLSLALHVTALAVLIALTHREVLPPALEEPAIGVVFQMPEEPPKSQPPANVEPVTETPRPPVLEPPLPEPPASEPQPPFQPQTPLPEAEPPPPPRDVQPPPRPPRVTRPTVVLRPPRLSPPPTVTTAQPAVSQPVASSAPPVKTAPAPVAPLVIDASWQASVAGWLASHKTYPEVARQRGEEGRVVIRFTIDRSGRVVDARVVGESGSALLDTAAMALVKGASFPPFPPTMSQERITITTMVRYTLR